ncbi:speriolin isoform X2 [Crotalus tigris]|uniref:speriolin isoform X2 n=1 Tax=Crotalus tigris TaxID=88082 RepID=UPI00192F4722|nr:speriolin isoform X2 [Crotalus tigris]
MAIFTRYEALRKEIKALVAENEELKQLVLLLRENQELKSVLHDQFNERNLLPNFESTRLDQQEPLLNQAFLDASNLDQSQSSPSTILRLGIRQRHPSGLTAQLTTQYPPPPPSPPGGGVMASTPRGHSPPRFQVCSPSPVGSTSGVGGATISLQNASQRSSGSSIVPRGYCFECPIPWHPHLPGPSTPGGGLPLTMPASLPNLPATTQPGGTFISPGNLTSTQLTPVFPGSSLPNLPAARQVGGTFSIPGSQGGMPHWYIGSSEIPSTQNLSQLPSVFYSPTRPTAGQGRGTFSIPGDEGLPKWYVDTAELPSTQNLSQLPSVFYSPTRPTAGPGRGTVSIPGDEVLPKWYLDTAELPSTQNLSQLPSVFYSPTRPTAGPGRGTISIRGDEVLPKWYLDTAELPSTQNLSQLTSVFGSPIRPTAGQGGVTCSIPSTLGSLQPPSTQNLSQLTSVFGSSLPSTQLISQLPSAFLSPTQPATAGQGGGTFPFPCAPGSPEAPSTQNLSQLTSVFGSSLPSTQLISQLPSAFLSPTQPATAGQGGGTFPFPCAPGSPEAPSTQNLSQLTSVFGSSLPSTQLISQLPSAFLSPTQPATAGQRGGTFSMPCVPGSPEAPSMQSLSPLPSLYMKPTARPRTRIFTFPSVPCSPELPSTQQVTFTGDMPSMTLPTQQQPFQPIETSSPIQPAQGGGTFSMPCAPGSPEALSMQSFSPLPSLYMKPTVRPRTRIFTFPSVPCSPELPSTQQVSQLPSMYMKPTSGEGGGTFYPSGQGTPEAPSTQNLSQLTSVFGSGLPSTQLISQLSSPFGSRDMPSMTYPTQQYPFQPIETSSPIQPVFGSGPCPPSYMVPSWDSYGGLQLPPPISDPFSQFSSELFPSGPGTGSDPGKPPRPRPPGLPLPPMPSISPPNLSQYLRFPGNIYNLGGDPNQAPYSPGQFSPYSPSGIFSQPDTCSPFSPGSSVGTIATPDGSPFFSLAPGSPDMSSLYGPMALAGPMSISGGLMTPSGSSASSGTSVFSSLAPDTSIGTIPSPYSSLGATSPFLPVPPAGSPDTSSLYGPMFPASYVSSLYGSMVPASTTSSSSPLFFSAPSSFLSPLLPASSPGTICVPSPIQFSPLATSPVPVMSPRPVTPPVLPSPISQALSPEPAEKSDRRTQASAMSKGL